MNSNPSEDPGADRALGYIAGRHLQIQSMTSRQDQNLEWKVEIEYELPDERRFPFSAEFDRALDKVALRLGGTIGDSGLGFGLRDISYEFSSSRKSAAFERYAEHLLRSYKLKGTIKAPNPEDE